LIGFVIFTEIQLSLPSLTPRANTVVHRNIVEVTENCGKSFLKGSDLGCVINSVIYVTEQPSMDLVCAMQLLMC